MLKKTMLAMALAATAATVMAADDKASASAVWTGFVPGVVTDSAITITGRDGGQILDGTLLVLEDGSFTSTPVRLEARDYDAVDGVGDLVTNASWTVDGIQVLYSGVGTLSDEDIESNVVVSFDGTDMVNRDPISTYTVRPVVDVQIRNKAAVVGVTPGTAVQAQVTVVATVI
ncbi:hypothetical protein [Aeromonas simiae]|uniref:hypothetical protein n=1 Tax=Aeromonas simiae TaxID=218936 RepID=UPI0006938F5E|nr:hypothetical protein [Aeromonas simiae]